MGMLAERRCMDCGLPLLKKAGRGRWPVRCPSCNAAKYPHQDAARTARAVQEPRPCAQCGNVYIPKHQPRGAGYCSNACKKKAYVSRHRDAINARRRLSRSDEEWRERDLDRKRKWRASGHGRGTTRRYVDRLRERAAHGDESARAILQRRLDESHALFTAPDTRVRDWSVKNQRRRARKRGAEGSFTNDELIAQAGRQKHRCYWNKAHRLGPVPHVDYHPDHVMPLALGGSDYISNIVAACPLCNLKKGAKHPMEFAGVLC